MIYRIAAVLIVFFVANSSVIAKNPFKNATGWCEIDYRTKYKKWPLHKAFASSGTVLQFSHGQGYGCGGTYRWATKSQAIQDALRRCELVRSSNHLAGRCKIIDAK